MGCVCDVPYPLHRNVSNTQLTGAFPATTASLGLGCDLSRTFLTCATKPKSFCLCSVRVVGDDCDNRVAINTGSRPVSTTNATTCSTCGACPIKNDVWFEWRASCTGTAVIDACGLGPTNTMMGVYRGAACPTAETSTATTESGGLDCDDFGGCAGANERATLSVVNGEVVIIRLGTFNSGDTAQGNLVVSCTPNPTPNPTPMPTPKPSPAPTTAVTTPAPLPPLLPTSTSNGAPELYYADYDNIVVAANDDLYYTSSLTQEAVDREKAAPTAAAWTKTKKLPVAELYNAKGVAFCGDKYSKDAPEGGKYGQLFVAEQGDDTHKGRVVGWEVVADAADPAAIKLQNPWDVYAPDNAAPTDVKCGPKDGLFIADRGNKGVYWVTNADLKAKQPTPAYDTIISAQECGDAAVANVRSLSYDPEAEKLSWSNNNEDVVENSGVFEVDQPATGVVPVNCKAKCDAWSSACTGNVKKVVDSELNERAWAVANAWGGKQVSKGAEKVYNDQDKVVAEVPKEATYAVAAQDPWRDVLLVSDAQEGAVYAAKQGSAAPAKIADAPEAYGVAYNNAWGWQAPADSASSLVTSTSRLATSPTVSTTTTTGLSLSLVQEPSPTSLSPETVTIVIAAASVGGVLLIGVIVACVVVARKKKRNAEAATATEMAAKWVDPTPTGLKQQPDLPASSAASLRSSAKEQSVVSPAAKAGYLPAVDAASLRKGDDSDAESEKTEKTVPYNRAPPSKNSKKAHKTKKSVADGSSIRPSKRPTANEVLHIELEEVELGKKLGEGAFGVVYKGKWHGKNVAVKQVKAGVIGGKKATAEFEAEVGNMAAITYHENLVQLHGVTTLENGDLAAVVEFCANGALVTALYGKKARTDLTADQLMRIAHGAACGVAHLHRLSVVHRDIAARNVLLAKDDTPKVADFGMARLVSDDVYEQQTTNPIGPLKWMAPEQMESRLYSKASDVFAFGVLLFEIFKREAPWSGVYNLDVAFKIRTGERMDVSSRKIPSEIATLMKECWAHAAKERPSMEKVQTVLHDCLREDYSSESSSVSSQ
jgi:hypothetical protein